MALNSYEIFFTFFISNYNVRTSFNMCALVIFNFFKPFFVMFCDMFVKGIGLCHSSKNYVKKKCSDFPECVYYDTKVLK